MINTTVLHTHLLQVTDMVECVDVEMNILQERKIVLLGGLWLSLIHPSHIFTYLQGSSEQNTDTSTHIIAGMKMRMTAPLSE